MIAPPYFFSTSNCERDNLMLIQVRRNLIAWPENGIDAFPDRRVFHQAVA